jgi:hypothetical protein
VVDVGAVGEGWLPKHNPDVHDEDFIKGEARGHRWSTLGAAAPIAHNNRLFVRSFDYLWCIGQ